VSKHVSVVVHALVGWAICGATVGIGRQLVSMDATLVIHAMVAPLAFGLLTWRHFKRFPESSAAATALIMVGVVLGLDALVVAPFLERSYAMFRSIMGTWVPFASILAASYFVGRATRARNRTRGSRGDNAAEQVAVPGGRVDRGDAGERGGPLDERLP
jgi:hypothetical protein